MEISPIYIQSKSNNNNPAFGSIATGLGESVLRPELRMNYTVFVDRCFCNINKLVNDGIRLSEKGDAPLEIVVCGCSDGTKALEYQMGFAKRYKEIGKSLDELPIIRAFDLNENMVNLAKNGRLNVSNRELVNLCEIYPNLFKDYFIKEMPLLDIPNNDIKFIENALNTKYSHSYQYNPELLSKIDFYQSDLLTELGKMKPDKYRLLSCENLAIYLKDDEQKRVAELMDKNLRPESKVIVGDRDSHCDIVIDDKTLNAEFPNLSPQYKRALWKTGWLTNPNMMVKTLRGLRFRENTDISDCQCVYEKLYDPERTMNFYQMANK